MTEYLIPAPIKKKEAEMITDTALRCHRALECSALSRVDLILGDDRKAYFLEVNTIPGMG
ncbi:MAG: D-alanine--D-alanine ligase, partial [Actinobacteria bacterium]|nr:D-alanine--D-alanine ligase [Actinomycetota bacterium]